MCDAGRPNGEKDAVLLLVSEQGMLAGSDVTVCEPIRPVAEGQHESVGEGADRQMKAFSFSFSFFSSVFSSPVVVLF